MTWEHMLSEKSSMQVLYREYACNFVIKKNMYVVYYVSIQAEEKKTRYKYTNV